MLFFNPFALARALRDNSLSEDIRFRFVMMGLVFSTIYSLMDSLAVSAGASKMTTTVSYSAIILVGVYWAHSTNARGDNRAFIERWICLGVPLHWWLRLLPYALDIALYRSVSLSTLRSMAPMIHVWIWGRYVLFYIALNFLMRIAAGGLGSEDQGHLAPIASP